MGVLLRHVYKAQYAATSIKRLGLYATTVSLITADHIAGLTLKIISQFRTSTLEIKNREGRLTCGAKYSSGYMLSVAFDILWINTKAKNSIYLVSFETSLL